MWRLARLGSGTRLPLHFGTHRNFAESSSPGAEVQEQQRNRNTKEKLPNLPNLPKYTLGVGGIEVGLAQFFEMKKGVWGKLLIDWEGELHCDRGCGEVASQRLVTL